MERDVCPGVSVLPRLILAVVLLAVGDKAFRIGPWGQVSSWNFHNVVPEVGAEVMVSVPLGRGRLMPEWSTGGSLDKAIGIGLRAGLGSSFSGSEGGHTPSGRVYEATVTVGVRTNEQRNCNSDSVDGAPRGQFYSWGVRGFVTGRRMMIDDREWQLVIGIEIEPATLFFLPRVIREWHEPPPEPV